MNKFDLLKSIVDSEHMFYPLHNDIPPDERKSLNELECEGYLYNNGNHLLKPTKEGMQATKFNSFEEYESKSKQNPINITNTNNINGGFIKVENNSNINSPQTEQKKENIIGKIITWLATLFKK